MQKHDGSFESTHYLQLPVDDERRQFCERFNDPSPSVRLSAYALAPGYIRELFGESRGGGHFSVDLCHRNEIETDVAFSDDESMKEELAAANAYLGGDSVVIPRDVAPRCIQVQGTEDERVKYFIRTRQVLRNESRGYSVYKNSHFLGSQRLLDLACIKSTFQMAGNLTEKEIKRLEGVLDLIGADRGDLVLPIGVNYFAAKECPKVVPTERGVVERRKYLFRAAGGV